MVCTITYSSAEPYHPKRFACSAIARQLSAAPRSIRFASGSSALSANLSHSVALARKIVYLIQGVTIPIWG
jgi:hypothetical protein